jgi:primosomal protein N' (replication factor Y)
MTLSHHDERELASASVILSDMLKKLSRDEFSNVPMVVFGPFEASVFKVDGKYRMRMVIKCRLGRRSRALFSELLKAYGKQGGRTALSVDFNPTGLLSLKRGTDRIDICERKAKNG